MPLVTVPVVASITAVSIGAELKANKPPVNPVIFTLPPSQVGVTVNEASSKSRTLNV